ncbi:DNA polymerase III subunit gamma/tau [Metabacillus fastidiosus]|uniref:DNA polymerase III subunit gamma/tau n=1 Tax=Metabacillus fastidiosus TaxID=1458 RepID=UPI002E1B4FBC|nr:DNA polymerase III subunit gamma/tau [Metabacillus fastidiosus]MED4532304.1 DNA polymerase III subunit gamma/tau [Metabacillus fastidiosus]
MSYQALYRVWRPQQFHDVVGQEHITRTLQNALLHNKFSHAYLFSGPRGTGKTSAAKIFAKTVNCENAPVSEPCNECAACRGITDGSISDVIEIDAASNNGVDEIRDIRDKVKFAPSAVKYKVYIVDEVHMLSIGAFNALLKTLEEPPKHVIFILATTEPHKIPLTIISRCQRFDFRRITAQSIVGRMEEIIRGQQVEVESAAMSIIARAADGGMRDALSLLDQAISFSDEKVTLEDALLITGSVAQGIISDLAKSIHEKDVSKALQALDLLMQEGKDPTRFIEDFIYYYRDMLLYKTAPDLEEVLERVTVDEEFKTLANILSANEIYETIDVLNTSQQEMKWTNHPRIFLEVAIVKLAQEQISAPSETGNQDITLLTEKINYLESELARLKQSGIAVQQQPQTTGESRQKSVRSGGYRLPEGRIREILKNATRQDLHTVKSRWGEMLETLKRQNKVSHAALLTDSEPVAASENAFILKFKYEIHCKMVAENNNNVLTNLQMILQEIIGKSLEIVGVPEQEWGKIREEFLQNQKQDNDGEEEISEDPLIAEAKKLVGLELIEINEE